MVLMETKYVGRYVQNNVMSVTTISITQSVNDSGVSKGANASLWSSFDVEVRYNYEECIKLIRKLQHEYNIT